jgi:GTP cyclohydrolase I
MGSRLTPENIQTMTRVLEIIGDNPNRSGLIDTPKRVLKAYDEWFAGYDQKPEEILSRQFELEDCLIDEMIMCKDIEFYSMCEHHIAPFIGVAHVAYIPQKGGKVVGLSKLARLVDCFARRLQIQERMTVEIARAIETHLDPLGVGVVVEAKHMCMCSRGVNKQSSKMVTSTLLGQFKKSVRTRNEFMKLIQG